MSEDKKQKWCDNYVNYYVFIWAIGIVTTLIMIAIGASMSAKAEVGIVGAKLETQMNDTEWIKQTLSEIKSDIKSLK
jgi:hypothetical protein